jgi:hypothetical protein
MFAVERTANIRTICLKRKKLLMREGLKIVRDPIARKAFVFNFLPLLAFRCFLAGLRKLKEKSLCDLCDSSEAGCEPMPK